MNWNSSRLNNCLYLGLLLWVFSAGSHAGLCAKIEALNSFESGDRITSPYFDEYYIRAHNDVYYIYASKLAQMDFSTAAEVMSDLQSHPSFIPGYQSTRVASGPQAELLTGISFRAAFSPFSSSFTNQVEIIHEQDRYRQCWEQLEAGDWRVIEAHRNAPRENRGYWWFDRSSESSVGIHYFSMVQPPLAIPAWLYTRIVRGSYIELFDRIIARIKRVSETALLETQTEATEPPSSVN